MTSLIPQRSPAGMLQAMELAIRSHCLSSVATQRLAPKAWPELTKGLYRLCKFLSSITSTCSIQVTCRDAFNLY